MGYPSTALGPGGETWIEWGRKYLHDYWDKHHQPKWLGWTVKDEVEILEEVLSVELRDWKSLGHETIACPPAWPPPCLCTRYFDQVDYDVTVRYTIYGLVVDKDGNTICKLELGVATWTYGVFNEVSSFVMVECMPAGGEDLPRPSDLASLAPAEAAARLAARQRLASITIPGWVAASTLTHWIADEPTQDRPQLGDGTKTLSWGSYRKEVVRLPAMQQEVQERLVEEVLPLLGKHLLRP